MVRPITKQYLRERQYSTTEKLEARMRLHQRFGATTESFHTWVGSLLTLERLIDVLEVGCGTGIFWRENLHRLPNGSRLTLTDFSAAMVERARGSFPDPAIAIQIADLENLPFDDQSFDLVNAHHVLYHAQEPGRALSEIRRVLRPESTASITTNSARHMRVLYELGHSLDTRFPTDRVIDPFTEEIADRMLPKHFSAVEKHVREDVLKVNDVQALLDHVASHVAPRAVVLGDDFWERYADVVDAEIERHGRFDVSTRSPLYICRV